MCVRLRGGAPVHVTAGGRRDDPRRGRRRSSAGPERGAAGRHDPARGERRVRRQLRAAGQGRATQWITVRTAAPDSVLPPAGVRIQPAHARCWRAFARRTRMRGAAHRPRRASLGHPLPRFPGQPGRASATSSSSATASSAQNSLAQVPHHIVLSHVYVHGDPLHRPEARHRAERGPRHDRRLVHRRVQRRRPGHPGDRRLERSGPVPDREQLPRSRRARTCCSAAPIRRFPNLVADGITFRRNYLSRPMAWRNPIIPTPQA